MAYSTNGMPVHLGLGAGVDGDGMIPNIAFKVKTRAKTADYTVLAAESGSRFTNLGATAAVNFTLPAPAAGLIYQFYVAADVSVTVTGGTAGDLVALNNAAADSVAFSTTSLMIGGCFEVWSDGTSFYVNILSDGNTVTVA
ncbi:MAG: hypothetical protein GY755_01775 [Chloroflexi bacterium]|nr:hypothetical protein [Chloroflexota bacterium]